MNNKNLKEKIPQEVSHVTETLEKAGFEAYLVGGCVRDLVMGLEPRDWDVNTNAKPEEIIKLFPKTVYENAFGTVGVVNEEVPARPDDSGRSGGSRETTRVGEVTPY